MLEHWGTSHRELFISLRPTLRYDEYAQLHVRSGPDVSAAARALGDAGGPEFDGIAKVGYASATSIAACFASPAALAANVRLVRDEVTFIDGHRSVLVYGGR